MNEKLILGILVVAALGLVVYAAIGVGDIAGCHAAGGIPVRGMATIRCIDSNAVLK